MDTSRRRLTPLYAAAFVDMVGMAMILPLLPFHAGAQEASASAVGGLIAAYALAQLVAAPPSALSRPPSPMASARLTEPGGSGGSRRSPCPTRRSPAWWASQGGSGSAGGWVRCSRSTPWPSAPFME